MRKPARKNRHTLIICAAIAAVTFIVYLPVRNYDFVDYDDPAYILENQHVTKGLTAENLYWAFTAAHSSNWHPLTWLSHMLDCELSGTDPGPPHLVNVLLHIANVLLLFLLLSRLTGAVWPSAFVAAAFALHPAHVEAVAWISQRKTILAALFWLLTMSAYVRYTRTNQRQWYIATITLYALGLMAKPMLVTLPFALLLIDYWPLNRLAPYHGHLARGPLVPKKPPPSPKTSKSKIIGHQSNFAKGTPDKLSIINLFTEKLPLFILAAISSMVTFFVQQAGGSVVGAALGTGIRLSNIFVSYVKYILMAVWPANLAPYYPFPLHIATTSVALAALILALITALFFCWRTGHPYLLVGWLWFLGTLVPVVGIVQVGGQSMADRYTYLPYIGLYIIAGWTVPQLLRKLRYNRRILTATALAAIAALAVATRCQLTYWRNTDTLMNHALEVTENNCVAHYGLARSLIAQGKYEDGAVHYIKAIRLKHDFWQALLGLMVLQDNTDLPPVHAVIAKAFADKDLAAQAVDALSQAVQKQQDDSDLHFYLAKALLTTGRTEQAAAQFQKAVALQSDNQIYHNELAIALARLGRTDDAIAHFRQAAALDPDFASAYGNIAAALLRADRTDEAVEILRQTKLRFPDYLRARYQLAEALTRIGRPDDAAAELEQLLDTAPDEHNAMTLLAWAIATQSDSTTDQRSRSLELAQKACALTENKDARSLDTLAAAYAAVGRFDDAVSAAQKALKLAKSHDPELATQIQNRLALYKAQKPFIED